MASDSILPELIFEKTLKEYVLEEVAKYVGQSGIYSLCDPETGERLYVGKASCIAARYKGHVSNINGKTPKDDWIRKLLLNGTYPRIDVLEVCELDKIDSRERHWIDQLFGNGEKTVNSSGTKRKPFFGETYRTQGRPAKPKPSRPSRPRAMPGGVTVTTMIDAGTLAKLDTVAESRGMTRAGLMRDMIEKEVMR